MKAEAQLWLSDALIVMSILIQAMGIQNQIIKAGMQDYFEQFGHLKEAGKENLYELEDEAWMAQTIIGGVVVCLPL